MRKCILEYRQGSIIFYNEDLSIPKVASLGNFLHLHRECEDGTRHQKMNEECANDEKDENKDKDKDSNLQTQEPKVEPQAEKPETPAYSNELSIFQKETLQKIEEFRRARRNWTESSAGQKIITEVNQGTHKTNLYKGRCNCLRRIGFKSTFLRRHRKTVRPLRFFSLKTKPPRPKVRRSPAGSQESVFSVSSRTDYKDYVTYPISEKNNSDLETKTHEENLSKLERFFKKKSKPKPGKKSRESGESSSKTLKPSKKAIKKLKAAKLENTDTEPYTCKDGSDLTVVLKGVCPNYKRVLNKSKLEKVCDKYSRLTEDESVESEEAVLCQTKDSLEIHQKKISKKNTCSNDINENGSDVTAGSSKSEEMIFCHVKDSLEIHQKQIGRKKMREGKDVFDETGSEAIAGAAIAPENPVEKAKVEEVVVVENEEKKKTEEEEKKKASLVTLYENPEKSLTKEELLKMGRICEETIIVKL